MKYPIQLLLLMLLLFKLPVQAQKMGMIQDPDGYTNIRKGMGTQHDIIGKLTTGERFLYYESTTSHWWKVETIPYMEEPLTGFVHQSRIQAFVDQKPDCGCIQPWGITDEQPVLTVPIGQTTVTVCGFHMDTYDDSSVKISEFSIGDCSSDQVMAFFGAVTTCKVTAKENELEVIVLDRLPAGAGFQWIELPYQRMTITPVYGYPHLSATELVLDLSAITPADLAAFEKELPDYQGRGFFEGIEDFIGKLAISTMKGSTGSRKVFNDVDNYLNTVIDGGLKEFHQDCSQVIAAYEHR